MQSRAAFLDYITIAVIGYLSYCGTITPNVLDSLQNVEKGEREVGKDPSPGPGP